MNIINPVEAYYQGRQAKKDNPTVTIWNDIIPYSSLRLGRPWIDGWRDESLKREPLVPIAVENGRCPVCWSAGLHVNKEGKLWCLLYPCRDLVSRPNGRIIEESIHEEAKKIWIQDQEEEKK